MSTVNSFKRVARDVTDLCELQFQLLTIDGKVAVQRGALALVSIILAASIAVSAITVLLIAAGWALHESYQWTVSAGLIASGLLAMTVCLLLAIVSFIAVKQAFASLAETRSELAQNLKWLKSVIADDQSANKPKHGPVFNDRFSRSFD